MADVGENITCEPIHDDPSSYPKRVGNQLWTLVNGPHETELECHDHCGPCGEGIPGVSVRYSWTDDDKCKKFLGQIWKNGQSRVLCPTSYEHVKFCTRTGTHTTHPTEDATIKHMTAKPAKEVWNLVASDMSLRMGQYSGCSSNVEKHYHSGVRTRTDCFLKSRPRCFNIYRGANGSGVYQYAVRHNPTCACGYRNLSSDTVDNGACDPIQSGSYIHDKGGSVSDGNITVSWTGLIR